MHNGMLKARAGFTLAEMLIALTLTAVLGATITGAFVSQSRFFEKQEKVGAARSVARAGTNMLLADLRMVEVSGGVQAASNTSVTLKVPYALGLACNFSSSNSKLKISQLPVDSLVSATAGYSGYAHRVGNSYTYKNSGGKPSDAATPTDCETAQVEVLTEGKVVEIPGGVSLKTGTPVFLYQTITYAFKTSTSVPGRLGLFRRLHDPLSGSYPAEEELAAPFDAGAGFRFFVDHTGISQTTVPSPLSSITGLEVELDGLSERPESDGTHQVVEHVTAVFFKNR
jgi:prepilin-type N-terminal cleavage/methylation domain-containing protein